MATSQQQKLSIRPATVDDMIGWLTEQAFHSGQIGFSNTWRPQNISALSSARPSPHPSSSSSSIALSDEIDITTALGHAIGDWHRDQYLANVVRANMAMLKETEEVVHERLRRAGMQEKDFENLVQQKAGLRTKIARLHELPTRHLQPRAGELFVVWLIKEEDKVKEKVKVYLPKRGSFGHFLAIFRDIWLAKPYPNVELERTLDFGAGAWTYQLVNKQSQVLASASRVKLVEESDYRDMVRQITKKGSETPSAVFWHESTLRSAGTQTGQEEAVEDETEIEELDENGEPYFQHVDWKMLLQKGMSASGLVERPLSETEARIME
ncbi:MAG: hypothetical protein M1830_002049 [Pleopsidium flavum]|nr:MAG: hypothetical protein M1830_002049 [Pleopsidium flavum]